MFHTWATLPFLSFVNYFSFVLSCLTMSESESPLERHIFGDSNIVRYLPKLKEPKSDPTIQAVSMTKATNAVLLRDGLSNPKSAYPIIRVAALTNLITAKYFEDYDLLVDHCKTTFNDVLLWVQEGRDNLDDFAALVRNNYVSVSACCLVIFYVKHCRILVQFTDKACQPATATVKLITIPYIF
jgi:hypothetical protein